MRQRVFFMLLRGMEIWGGGISKMLLFDHLRIYSENYYTDEDCFVNYMA